MLTYIVKELDLVGVGVGVHDALQVQVASLRHEVRPLWPADLQSGHGPVWPRGGGGGLVRTLFGNSR